jgi:hypothetical protein
MDGDGESIFDRLWRAVFGRFEYLVPLWIVRRPESLVIYDYRPTFLMFLAAACFVVLAVFAVLAFLNVADSIPTLIGATAAPIVVGIFLLFKFTVREVYYFDQAKDSYALVRQFVFRKEVIEGSLSQFTGAYVKTESDDNNKSYFVVLQQEGMFLTGASEQILREEVPLFNSFEREARIAGAISSCVSAKRA